MRRLLWETLLVGVFGVAGALFANFISPRGLSLTRNYFPAQSVTELSPASTQLTRGAGPTGPQVDVAAAQPAVDVRSKTDVAIITTAQALEFFRDPEYQQELIVFVDARDSRHYDAGHIPGAFQLDRYYPQNHLPTVLPACLSAKRVVVYCAGGECEDSHFAAQLLREAGVSPDVLSVYAGGMTEWKARQLPVETGGRKSGNVQ
jgi:rhodanese-related sulfurtransferase